MPAVRAPTPATAPPFAAVNRTGPRIARAWKHRPVTHDEQPLLDEGPRHSGSGAAEGAAKGGPRHAHPLGCGLLVQTLEVGEAEGLELVEPKRLDLEAGYRASDWLEATTTGEASDPSELLRSRHGTSRFRTYAQNGGLSSVVVCGCEARGLPGTGAPVRR